RATPPAHRRPGSVPTRRSSDLDLVREREQVELDTELTVVALLGLGEPVEVVGQLRLGRPRGAVDPLQLLVGLVPTPVRSSTAHEDRKSTRLNSSHVKISYAVFR